MAVFRVEKTRNYTVMSNHHLRDKSLSLKAKGLLSLMLSLPEDWDYTTRGLAYICKDGVDSICATVRELEGAGYIVRARERHADGTLGGIEYTILEQPRGMDAPEQENPAQLNIQEQSKEILSTDVTKSFPSFPHKGKPIQESGMERRETYREQIMTNVDYNYLVGYTEVDRGRLDELVGLMLDTVCSTKPTLEVTLVNIMSRETVLRQYLYTVAPAYDYAIIDCMPSLGMLTINALTAADSVIIPVQGQYLAAKGLEQLMRTIARVKRQINPHLTVDGILLTMMDSRTTLAKEISEQLRRNYGSRVFASEIPRSIRVAEISVTGTSIYEHDPEGKAAKAYSALTKEVLQLGPQIKRHRADPVR